MKYIPKTLPLMEVDVPRVYYERVMETIAVIEFGNAGIILDRRPYLINVGLVRAYDQLVQTLGGRTSKAAKAYDILFFTLLIRELEHDRTRVSSTNVTSGEFEQELVGLLGDIREADDPVYLDEVCEQA